MPIFASYRALTLSLSKGLLRKGPFDKLRMSARGHKRSAGVRLMASDRMAFGVDEEFAAADVVGGADEAVLFHPFD